MATKFLGLALDPTPAGSTKDILGGSPSYPVPTIYVPVTTGQASPGYTNLARNNEVRGVRGNTAPAAFRAAPTINFGVRLYPTVAKFLLPKALGGAITTTGTAPAAITSKIGIDPSTLPAITALMVRGSQMDRQTGIWIDSAELAFGGDDDPMLNITARALWHKHYPSAGLPTPTFIDEQPYSTVRLATKIGSSSTSVQCVGDVSLAFNNNLVTDNEQLYCKNENIETTNVSGRYAVRQYPGRHKLGDPTITGSLGFGTERTDIEDRMRIAQADKLVFEISGDPITPATTPAADELLRITLPKAVFTSGGASELVDERDPSSNYEFEGFIDPASGDNVTVEFVGKTAVA